MQNDHTDIFSESFVFFQHLSLMTCKNASRDCQLCSDINTTCSELLMSKNYIGARLQKKLQLIVLWVKFHDIATFYAQCNRHYATIPYKRDDAHSTIWTLIIENQHVCRLANMEYWRKNFAQFLSNEVEFFGALRFLFDFAVIPAESLRNFCAQLVARVDNDMFYEISEGNIKILNNRKAMAGNEIERQNFKHRWLYQLELFAMQLRQRI